MKFLGFHNCAFLLCADEIREMIERVENRGLDLEEALELEGTEDEFSKCRKSKIKYTRALLLELTEVEICRNLPNDFDLLLLRELDGGSDDTVEHKSIIGTPFDHGPLLTTPWNLACPGERWNGHLSMQSKESHWQRFCSSKRNEAWQPLLQKPEKDAGVLHCAIQKSDLFKLRKTENPYRPPHLNKKMPQPLPTFYEPGEESSGDSDRKGPADDIAGNENSGCGFTLAVADDSKKEPVGKSEVFRRKIAGNEVIESSKPLDEYEDFWRKSEGNVVIGGNNILEGRLMDQQPTFDDFWAEILETIHLQKEPNISPTNIHADSEVEIHFPDEETLVGPLLVPDNSNNLNMDDSNGVANSEDEINLPDEDSLISIHDMITPYSSTPTLNSGSWEADKVTSNTAFNIRKSSKSANVANLPDEDSSISIHDMIAPYSSMPTLKSGSGEADKVTSNIAVDIRKYSKSADVAKRDDNSKRIRLKAQRYPDFSLPQHLLCDQTGLPPLFLTHNNNLSYIPSINNFSRTDIRFPFFPESTLPNTETYNYLMSQYSLFQQPYIFPLQPNHPLAVYDLDPMQFLHSTSQQTAIYNYKGFGKSKTADNT